VSTGDIPKGKMSIIAGLAAIVLGIFALIFPVLAFSLIEYLFAIYAVVMSAGMVMTGVGLQKEHRSQGLLLTVAGVAGICIGIAIVVAPRIMAVTAFVVLGIWAIVAGVSDLIFVFTSAGNAQRTFKAATGILTCAAGLLILIAPKLVDGFIIVTFVGIFAILAGILTLLFGTAEDPKKRPINHYIYK
jgi:uncharacterized membrane protein HdeD (DUF308 family)